MLAYRSNSRVVAIDDLFDDLEVRARALGSDLAADDDALRDLLVRAGMLESALADGDCPEVDDQTPLAAAMNAILTRIASLFVQFSRIRPIDAGSILALLQKARTCAPRGVVSISAPEGFAYYGLFPETYVSAANRVVAQCAPTSAMVIGIRSIGTTLSAVVTATLAWHGARATRLTVRPRGHPFDRQLRLSPRLTRVIADAAPSPSTMFLVVDEGPGLSGSSFGCVAEALSQLGIPDHRIVFLPSWNPSASALSNERARSRWTRHRTFIGDFDEEWIATGRLARHCRVELLGDLSAGQWREELYASRDHYPAVQPQHERRKLLGKAEDGERRLLKFEGLGSLGAPRQERALRLASAGFVPPVASMRDGFLSRKWVDGMPLTPRDASRSFLEHVARYLAWLRSHERLELDCDYGSLFEMLEVNTREALGREWLEPLQALRARLGAVPPQPAVRIDGRMLPHEWLRTGSGYVKTDALSHHDDHFYPGPHDIAWDVAGVCAEFALDDAAEALLVGEYARQSGDHGIEARLGVALPAYLGFRLGYTTLAAQALGESDDGRRMRAASVRYRDDLRRVLASCLTPVSAGVSGDQSYDNDT